MWYKLLKRKIERHETEGLKEIVNTMYAAGQMNDEQYKELISLL